MGLLNWLFGPDVHIQEAEPIATSGYSGDPDVNLTDVQGGSRYFRSLTQGQRDLPEITQERSIEIAYYLYETNPAAGNVLEGTKDFVVGEGVHALSTEKDDDLRQAMQDVIDGFWNDPINNMDVKLHSKVMELGLFGEQIYPVFVNPVNGRVRLGYIDPASVAGVVTDPDNVENLIAIKVKGKPGEPTRMYRVVHVDETDPGSPTFGRMIGAAKSESIASGNNAEVQYVGSCFYFAINKVSNARRGRSDLLRVADWIDAYDQYLFNELDRALIMKTFVFDTTLKGMNDAQIVEYAKKQPRAKSGTEFYHNDNVIRQAVTPDLKAQDASAGADLILSYVATGLRRPKTWLNGMMDVNRASAAEMSEPGLKALAARQMYVRYMIEHILLFVLDQAELHGTLSRRENDVVPPNWNYTVSMPEMRSKDLSQAATALNQVAQALATSMADDVIDVHTAQEVLVSLITQFGVEVDLEEMRTRLEEAKKQKDEQAATFPYPTEGSNGTIDAAGKVNGDNGAKGNGQLNEAYTVVSRPAGFVSAMERSSSLPIGFAEAVNPHHDKLGRFSSGGSGAVASKRELADVRNLVKTKVAVAPVPSAGTVTRARAELELAKEGGRPGGEARGGSASDRRQQRLNLFKEFGGDQRGYVVDHGTGIKMHYSADPKINPNGYPLFERGKIFTKVQGGGYQLPNLIPESFYTNRTRDSKPVRKENLP